MNSIYIDVYSLILYAYIFIVGLCFGSFLNVVILRGLSGENIVFARSKCPKCNNQLKWYMNIPLFSYMFLKGKCAFCKNPISIQYPVVELITALLFLGSFMIFGFGLKGVFVCIFSFFLVALFTTDFKQKVIVDYHSYILLFFGLLGSCMGLFDIDIKTSLVGAICGFIAFEAISQISKLIIKQRVFGFGDSLIVLALGSIFGFKKLLILILASILLQGIMALPILAYHSFKENKIRLFNSYILVFISMIYMGFAKYFNFEQYGFYGVTILILALVLLWALKNILGSIKEKRERLNPDSDDYETNYSFMPFGPALVVVAFVMLFAQI